MTDFPNTRRNTVCPLCAGHKDRGLVACWVCYRKYDMRNGSQAAEDKIATFEAMLEGGFACTLGE